MSLSQCDVLMTEIRAVETDKIGACVDHVCHNTRRDVREVAGRLLEEVVELAAACGVSPDKMRAHVEDSIHNMCLKQSYADGHTIFPSKLRSEYNSNEVVSEAGDVLLLLKDVLYLAGWSQESAERRAYGKFLTLRNQPGDYTSLNGSTFYKIKAHVK